MSDFAPHFTSEWLKQYQARLRSFSKRDTETEAPALPPKPVRPRKPAKPNPAPSRVGACVPVGELKPYSCENPRPVPVSGWTGKQTETEKRYNALCLYGHGRFEAVCLYLPGGGRYTPDFMTMDGGVVTFHEVKGSYRLQSQGRAYTAFHEAAAAFPCFRFVWATETKTKGKFEIKVFDPKTETGR